MSMAFRILAMNSILDQEQGTRPRSVARLRNEQTMMLVVEL